MASFSVFFQPHGRRVRVPKGASILRAALDAGVHINASCGGDGVCGKCRIQIESGRVDGKRSDRIRASEWVDGYRLACKATVCEDVTIRVPMESDLDPAALEGPVSARCTARLVRPALEDILDDVLDGYPAIPPLEKVYLELPPPTAGDNLPDTTRLINELRRQYDEHGLAIDYEVIRRLPDTLRNADFKVTATLLRPVWPNSKTRVLHVAAGNSITDNLAVPVDIGTTTVQGRLVDLGTGSLLAEAAAFNGQISYGEDVITRIMVAEKGDGLEKLHLKAAETINGIIDRLCKKAGIAMEGITLVVLAGNTTMTQLMLRINPRYIRRSPYVPAGSLYPPLKAREIDLDLADHARVLSFPQVSSYVGGDIIAGVLASGMYKQDAFTLFLDIGTNAEIVIGNREWLVCAACSAGPAFEGGGIQFGMRASPGAIEDFSINPLTLEPMLLTVGNARPKGICGSGLITMVATLFEAGVIDQRGKFNRELKTDRIRRTDAVWEYVVAWREGTRIDRDIVLTEIDIENLIRAKGAIYSGCMTLLHEVGMTMEMLDRIILAGGFGSYVDLEKAMTIGLLPEIETEKVVYIGNSSLAGAEFVARSNVLRRDVVDLADRITNFELSDTPSYMDHYMASLFLPHTDLDCFPKVKARMAHRNIAN